MPETKKVKKVKKLQIIGKFPSGEIDHAEVQAIVNDYLVENPPKPQITINGKGPDENGNFVVDGGNGVKFETDTTLKLENGVLSVNTTNQMDQDNTLPITSAGVYATVGNIEALLKTI